MGFETPNFEVSETEKELSQEELDRKELRGIVDVVFSDKEEIFKRHGGEFRQHEKELSPEVIDAEVEQWRDEYADSIKIDPRFGTQKEYIERLKKELAALPSPDEKEAFFGGVADLVRGNDLQGGIRRKLDVGDAKKFTKADDLVMKGLLLRSVFDKGVMNSFLVSDLRFVKEYQDISRKSLVQNFVSDYEKMLNEGVAYEGGKLNDFEITSRLQEFGIEAEYEWSEEKKRNIFTLKEKEKPAEKT